MINLTQGSESSYKLLHTDDDTKMMIMIKTIMMKMIMLKYYCNLILCSLPPNYDSINNVNQDSEKNQKTKKIGNNYSPNIALFHVNLTSI